MKDGASHFREFASARVTAASSKTQSGSITSECVMLRCQVITRSGSREKISRKTSESGNIAPNISDQVMMRPRFIGCQANRPSPRKTAFPISAPAMPWVIVSILKVYWMLVMVMMLMNKEKGVFLRDNFSDAAGGNAVMLESGERRFGGFRRDGDEQAAGGLRVEEQILEFGRDAGVENRAIANESAVIP